MTQTSSTCKILKRYFFQTNVRINTITNKYFRSFKKMFFRIRSKRVGTYFVILCIVLLVYFYYSGSQYKRPVADNLHYTIVIDAGSTGSRIHVFKLYHDKSNESKIVFLRGLNFNIRHH